MAADIRSELSQALAGVDANFSRLVANGRTRIKEIPTSFLTRHRIYRVQYFLPTRPGLFYVGYAARGHAYLLTARPENLVRLAQADGVAFGSPGAAAELAGVYLEVTRTLAELFYQVGSVEDLDFRPTANATEEAEKAATIEKYRSVLQPPSALADGKRFIVTAYAVRQLSLERHVLFISRNGSFKDDVTVLERDLPLVFG